MSARQSCSPMCKKPWRRLSRLNKCSQWLLLFPQRNTFKWWIELPPLGRTLVFQQVYPKLLLTQMQLHREAHYSKAVTEHEASKESALEYSKQWATTKVLWAGTVLIELTLGRLMWKKCGEWTGVCVERKIILKGSHRWRDNHRPRYRRLQY